MTNTHKQGGLVQFFVFLLVCVGIAAVFSPWIYLGMQSLAAWTDADGVKTLAQYSFHRYFNRVLQVSIILGFWKVFKNSGCASLDALGLCSDRKIKDFAFGMLISLLFLGVYVFALFVVGFYSFKDLIPPSLGKVLGAIIFTALTVSFLEELFFRGFLYRLCRREWGVRWAVWFNCFFFASVHFLKPLPGKIVEVNYFSGFKLLGLVFYQFASTQFIPYFILLALLSWMFCWTLERTGSLWLAIGLHAGLILGIQVFGEITRYNSVLPQWYFGGGDLKQGIGALVPLGLQFLALYFWFNRTRNKLA